MAQSLVNIGGSIRDTATLQLPATRENRDAWALNGDVVEVDPALVTANAEARAAQLEASVLQDVGTLKAIADVIADVAFRVSTGAVPPNLTRAQARNFVRDQLRAAIRADQGL